jgi:hypothetical protein
LESDWRRSDDALLREVAEVLASAAWRAPRGCAGTST